MYPNKKEGYEPRPHQLKSAKRFMTTRKRGLALIHGLGSGKTCTYIEIANQWLEKNKDGRIVVWTSGSLRENFISQYCTLCGINTKNMLDKFLFVTYNYSLIINRLPNMDNALIIVDEAHDILHGKANGSPTLSEVYEAILNSKNSKILVGTGTPVVGNILELYYLIKWLNPDAIKNENTFLNMWLLSPNGVYEPKNPEIITKIIKEVIDYLPSIDDSDKTGKKSDYPTVTKKHVHIPINKNNRERLERIIYWRNKEIEAIPVGENVRLDKRKSLKTVYFILTSMIHSRQLSNIEYPSWDDAEYLKGSSSLLKTIPDETKERKLPDKLLSEGGWIDPQTIDEYIEENAEKIHAILKSIQINKGKHVIYSSFKTYYGEYLFKQLLGLKNIPYLVFDGEMDDAERENVLSKFNADDNAYGENYRVMLLTDAAAQGINLLAVRYMHILEQSISEYIIKQVEGRGNRYKSHMQLKPKERTLHIYRYFLDITASYPKFKNEIYSPDFAAYERGQRKLKTISYITDVLIPKMI